MRQKSSISGAAGCNGGLAYAVSEWRTLPADFTGCPVGRSGSYSPLLYHTCAFPAHHCPKAVRSLELCPTMNVYGPPVVSITQF